MLGTVNANKTTPQLLSLLHRTIVRYANLVGN